MEASGADDEDGNPWSLARVAGTAAPRASTTRTRKLLDGGVCQRESERRSTHGCYVYCSIRQT